MPENDRIETRTESTYRTCSNEIRPQIEIVKFIHFVDCDIPGRPGNIRVPYTIRGEKRSYMAYAEAQSVGGKNNINFKGSSLWAHNKMPLDKLEAMIDGITGMMSLRRNFDG